ncbi:hypothetical protein [uncultured Chitinophaga sp.]|uniref:hypothetical protein n=1 Tax=uncultured Chitinophaga sp. TaxID=339340 RepID=UPI0025D10471|nr:hypothetical protein [uncultured Chitinophaga sp.]
MSLSSTTVILSGKSTGLPSTNVSCSAIFSAASKAVITTRTVRDDFTSYCQRIFPDGFTARPSSTGTPNSSYTCTFTRVTSKLSSANMLMAVPSTVTCLITGAFIASDIASL